MSEIKTTDHITSLEQANVRLRRYYDNSYKTYDLTNMRKLMAFLDNPQDKYSVIHVAGTSGKTSTCYYISALLSATGKKTGLTVSPHVDKLSERVQINSSQYSEADFCKYLEEFLSKVEESSIEPSWFELVVAFAFWRFAEEKVDYAVVEVGLGGLLDGTNVINRPGKVCVITDIGYDHMDVLGNTLAKIATQKAGIIMPGNKVFIHEQDAEIMDVIEKTAKDKHADLTVLGASVNQEKDLPDYQYRNWTLALATYNYIVNRDKLQPLSEEQLDTAMHTQVPGRMDIRHLADKTIVMDGAHNFQKMVAFIDSYQKLYPDQKAAVLIAIREGKDYKDIVGPIIKVASRVIVTTFETNQDLPIKSMAVANLVNVFESHVPTVSIEDHKKAYQELLNGPESTFIITGSIYLLGQIRTLM